MSVEPATFREDPLKGTLEKSQLDISLFPDNNQIFFFFSFLFSFIFFFSKKNELNEERKKERKNKGKKERQKERKYTYLCAQAHFYAAKSVEYSAAFCVYYAIFSCWIYLRCFCSFMEGCVDVGVGDGDNYGNKLLQ